MNDRTKTVLMVFGLAQQLNAWLEYGRSFGHMTQKFKQSSKLLSDQCLSFNKQFGAIEDEVYEHSVQISDLFERVARLDENGIKSVLGLLNKIEKRDDQVKLRDGGHDPKGDGVHTGKISQTVQQPA